MMNIGFYIIPLSILIIVTTGFIQKVKVFDTFLLGAKQGLESTFSLIPSLVGLIVAISMLKSSGALDIFTNFISPVCNCIGIPKEVIPMALLRPISGSGSIALLDDILKSNGADSFIGKLASIISGSTETTFYTLTVYFGAVGIKNSRHAVPSAIIADIISVVASVITLNYFFNIL